MPTEIFFMDKLSASILPVEAELRQYKELFDSSLAHKDDLLGQALDYLRRRKGKMMRPLLVLLMAKEVGPVCPDSLRAAVTLELLHTASLVHDDVVDESPERRGQRSMNAVYDNKVAVLVGDYLLSEALLQAACTLQIKVVEIIARLGGTLSEGELCQLANIRKEEISEEAYFHVIMHKTAALFAACGELGAISAGGNDEYVEKARRFGELVGLCFQIRDDIFDYFESPVLGKPTGNDMAEGKLTLPAIFALKNTDREDVRAWACHVKSGFASPEEIHSLVEFTKQAGGIAYAEACMAKLHDEAVELLSDWKDEDVRTALKSYIDYVVEREM